MSTDDSVAPHASQRPARRWLLVAAGCAGVVLVSEAPVAAYVDPGTGSMAWQIIASAVLGLGFYLSRLRNLFRRRKTPPDDPQ